MVNKKGMLHSGEDLQMPHRSHSVYFIPALESVRNLEPTKESQVKNILEQIDSQGINNLNVFYAT